MDAAVSGTSRERTRLRGDTLRIALWLETKRQRSSFLTRQFTPNLTLLNFIFGRKRRELLSIMPFLLSPLFELQPRHALEFPCVARHEDGIARARCSGNEHIVRANELPFRFQLRTNGRVFPRGSRVEGNDFEWKKKLLDEQAILLHANAFLCSKHSPRSEAPCLTAPHLLTKRGCQGDEPSLAAPRLRYPIFTMGA